MKEKETVAIIWIKGMIAMIEDIIFTGRIEHMKWFILGLILHFAES